ncbi:hypothetical protein [Pelagibacterium luteolum]|uniref:hypothetical protein n=1 Tax=Pelagibacterium luteolum TaxID=440168 RepID=UPI0015A3181A|nr:hypothetical protein [Pelagibacterium luteolum]
MSISADALSAASLLNVFLCPRSSRSAILMRRFAEVVACAAIWSGNLSLSKKYRSIVSALKQTERAPSRSRRRRTNPASNVPAMIAPVIIIPAPMPGMKDILRPGPYRQARIV